jgi:hypothetical protein
MSTQFPAYGEFDGVRIGFYNASSATFSVESTKVAVTTSANVQGGSLTWLSVTTSGGVSATMPPASGTQGTSNLVPTYAISDYLAIPSVPRQDISGAMPIIQVRNRVLAASRMASLGIANMNTLNSLAGIELNAAYASGDKITSATNMTWLTSAGTGMWPCFVEFKYKKPVISLVTFGDSTLLGAGSVMTRFPIAVETARLAYTNNYKYVIAPSVGAVFGQTSQYSKLAFLEYLKVFKPTAAYIHSRSPNDYVTSYEQMCSEGYNNMMVMANACLDNGITPIIATSLPKGTSASPVVQVDRDVLTKYRNMVLDLANDPRYIIVDASSVLGDLTTWNFLPGMTDDGTHQTDLGIKAEGLALYNAIISKY